MSQMETEFGADFIHVDTHVSGDLLTTGVSSELTARGSRYGVSGIPDAFFDGTRRVTGAGSCASAASSYRTQINTILSTSGGVTSIALDVEMAIASGQATITGVAELVDNVSHPALQMTLFLVEEPVVDCCDAHGGDTYHAVTRGVRSAPITLTFGGGPVQVQQTWTVDSDWISGNLYAVGVVENVSAPRTVHQSDEFRNLLTVTFDQGIASVPEGNGSVEIPGTITNGNEAADLFDLTVNGDAPWTYEFQLAGDPNWYTATTIPLGAGESRDVTLRVTTDGTLTTSDAVLAAQAQSSVFGNSGKVRIFNSSPAILLVDADGSGAYEDPFEAAIPALGMLHDLYVAPSGQGPVFTGLNGYDLVIWETGFVIAAMADTRGEGLQEYLNNGGALLLSSMGFITSQASTPALRALLGVETYTSDTKAAQANGVNGDPISDGTAYSLVWPTPTSDRTDTINPLSTAATVYRNEDSESNVIRHELSGGNRVVYSSIQHTAFDAGAQAVAELMITWLAGSQDPAEVGTEAPFVSRMMAASPNPFSPSTELSFALSDWAALQDVSLRIVDASGRVVATLADGRLEPGAHTLAWDGRDSAGRPVPSGVYFGLLRTADGDLQTKVTKLAR